MDFTECYEDTVSSAAAAARSGCRRQLRRLIDRGCSVDGRDNRGWNPLHEAAAAGSKECVQEILSAVSGKKDQEMLNRCHWNFSVNQSVMISILCPGANVNAQAADLATPLLIASQEGHQDCVDLLLERGADPNMACSDDWPQLPIHAAAQFGRIRILRRLIEVTDRRCDGGEGMVSPLYVAISSEQSSSAELLLKEGYSADAQDCRLALGFPSPLSLAFYRTATQPCRDSVKLLLAAGAALKAEEWTYALATDKTDLLELILDYRWIRGPEAFHKDIPAGRHGGKTVLKLQELRELVCVALSQVNFASCWLPVLLNKGLDPYLLLHPHMLEKAESDVLNFLLQFINWSTLPPPLKIILEQREAEGTWEPLAHFASVPSLFHLCRLKVRDALGPDQLMTTDAVQQLPVPSPLHVFLQFRDIQKPSYTRPPPSPVINRVERHRSAHQHRHVL
ncbi:PREDICTED: ankyrin repeat and SOCS box protein 3-like [Cyprinodon variegatus]|uniref:ankyrin repeat and SOCS box protein 3-like n=1 Tax=Cyprinodon variegatus TaxID=28743 RepID=UPI00074262D7|nr:PREDICTED: ankyrin repeat and SOCS box protein 3-like [Cyprinodon variegatus]